MKIRKLKLKDAELMLEWMHDDFVVHDLATDFSTKTIEDCRNFINYSIEQYEDPNIRDIHMAIVDDNDEYMGTVSLKNIDHERHIAEFAITIRANAMGKGYSSFGMNKILEYGFTDSRLKLEEIYWCVNKKNLRARRFYDKHSFNKIIARDEMLEHYLDFNDKDNLVWYSVRKSESNGLKK